MPSVVRQLYIPWAVEKHWRMPKGRRADPDAREAQTPVDILPLESYRFKVKQQRQFGGF